MPSHCYTLPSLGWEFPYSIMGSESGAIEKKVKEDITLTQKGCTLHC